MCSRRFGHCGWRPLKLTVRRILEASLDPSSSPQYYSSMQITVATLIGGPLAGGYLASRDHTLFGDPGKGRLALVISSVVIIVLLYLGSILPPQNARSGLPFLAVIGYRVYSAYAFDSTIAQRRSEGWLQYSWWRAVGISLVILMAMIAIIVAGFSILNLHQ